ncbi:MAG: ATP-binding protein [Actinomycetota bacterium]
MEGTLAVPFHFAVEFLVIVVAIGAALDAVRARRHGAGLWAVGQALGFLSLAVAQYLHGALILQADADRTVLALRAAGFLLLALFSRPAAAVLPAFTPAAASAPALFFAGPQASLAFLPGLGALATALRGIRAHRVDQDPVTFAFAGAFLAFAAAEGATALSTPADGAWILGAHIARLLGALLLARWLWSSIARSVRMRFVATFVIVLTVGVLVVSATLNVVIGNTLKADEQKRLAAAGHGRVTALLDLGDSARSTTGTFASSAAFTDVFVSGDGCDGAVQALPILPPNADFLVLVDAKHKVIGSAGNTALQDPTLRLPPCVQGTHELRLPKTEEIALAGTGPVSEALGGRPSASSVPVTFATPEGSEQSQIVVVAAYPSRRGSRVVGAVAIGTRIDVAYLRGVKRDTGAEVTLMVGDRVTGTTLGEVAEVQPAINVFAGPLRVARENGVAFAHSLAVDGRVYESAFVPVSSADGQTIGLMVLSQESSVLMAAQRDATRVLFRVTLLAVMLAALLAWLSGGRVTGPIRSLTAAARELRSGNLDARARVVSVDEVGTLGTAFNEMASELGRTTGELRTAAETEAGLRGRLEAVVQSMGDGLIATDAAGHIVTFNRAAERMFGRRADRVLGKRIGDVVHGTTNSGSPLVDAAIQAGAAEGKVRGGGEGLSVDVAMTAAPLLDAAGFETGRVVVVRNVSREREAERMKSEFLSNVSHELRTPLTPIKGYAEILSRKDFPREKAMSFLEGILESTERLERIVEILVDFAAMEAGRLKPRAEPVSVRSLLDGVASRWRGRDGQHKFVRKGGIGLPPIRGDLRLLDRSLDELVDNAVKFSPKGGRIEISAESCKNDTRSRKTAKIRITIRDHGIGIDPENLPEMFRDFRQLDGSETRNFGGLGLGLAYVKRIATAHGGEVEVVSALGQGSSFSIVLPVAETTPRGGKK